MFVLSFLITSLNSLQYFAVSSMYTDQFVPGKGALFQTFSTWHPNTFCPYCIYSKWFTDLVQPSTDPVPPSTNQIVWWLVLYSWSCLSKIISYGFLLCSTVIGLDLESHSHSREKVQFLETRLRIIFLALAWRDEIKIIIWPLSYFKTRTRFHFVTLMFRDEIETSENHFSWSSEKKWSWLSSRIPGIENSRWPLVWICDMNSTLGSVVPLAMFIQGVPEKSLL